MQWYTKNYYEATKISNLEGMLIESKFRKVIFLDIDGVLNDDAEERAKQIINPIFVKNLAKIVHATYADIILSSSWRGSVMMYYRYNGDIEEYSKKNVSFLLDLFKENDLKISGITPMYFNGPDGRPFEIRTWLANRPNITHFLILDDDTFWNWGWLKDHFLCTKHSYKGEDGLWVENRGLTEDFVDKAIEILGGRATEPPKMSKEDERFYYEY